ncbi:MAG TPA: lipid-A-disaccharide synthase-related protein, partial [Allocoleopsis sp.]
MKLLCLSNGHGEDTIALRILQELQHHPAQPELAALPIVGEGTAYTQHNIPLAGHVQTVPSGGFIYMDGRQLARDLRGGLLKLTRMQLRTARNWAKTGGVILAVGDIVPLLFAWWSGAPYAFVGTAKSEYYLRDEQGMLPRRSWFERLESWSGSVYLPWERWLMHHPRCRAVFPRDRLTTLILKRWNLPVYDLGNPMMDGLEATESPFAVDAPEDYPLLTLALLPGSRVPEAYQNWQVILQAVAALIRAFPNKTLLLLAAIAPNLDRAELRHHAESMGWRINTITPQNTAPQNTTDLWLTQYRTTLVLTPSFNTCLHQADFAIAMAGTATEQFVGLGKPVITIPGQGPQFTPAFAEAQTRLLGPSISLVDSPTAVVRAVQSLLADPDRLQLIARSGRTRMGE